MGLAELVETGGVCGRVSVDNSVDVVFLGGFLLICLLVRFE